jgi:hypothetical protein
VLPVRRDVVLKKSFFSILPRSHILAGFCRLLEEGNLIHEQGVGAC